MKWIGNKSSSGGFVDFDQILSSTNTVKQWAGSEEASSDVALALLLIEKSTKQRKTIISILEKIALQAESTVTVADPPSEDLGSLTAGEEFPSSESLVLAESLPIPEPESLPEAPRGTVASCFFEKDRQPYLSISFLNSEDQEQVGRANLSLSLRARRSFVEAARILQTPSQGTRISEISLDALLPLILWF